MSAYLCRLLQRAPDDKKVTAADKCHFIHQLMYNINLTNYVVTISLPNKDTIKNDRIYFVYKNLH